MLWLIYPPSVAGARRPKSVGWRGTILFRDTGLGVKAELF